MLAARAEKARQAREEAAAALDQKLYDQLQKLQKRWGEVDKKVDLQRDEQFSVAKGRVSSWATKRLAAKEKYMKADELHAQRIIGTYQKKEERVVAWRKKVEADAERRSQELAASRSAASTRFEDELRQEASRLNDAQARAAERRAAFRREKRRQLEERAEAAEAKEDEMWAARVRMVEAHKKRIAEVEADCIRKAKQAQECVNQRLDRIHRWREDNGARREPHPRRPASYPIS